MALARRNAPRQSYDTLSRGIETGTEALVVRCRHRGRRHETVSMSISQPDLGHQSFEIPELARQPVIPCQDSCRSKKSEFRLGHYLTTGRIDPPALFADDRGLTIRINSRSVFRSVLCGKAS
jgi:hypothetical protein